MDGGVRSVQWSEGVFGRGRAGRVRGEMQGVEVEVWCVLCGGGGGGGGRG